MNQFSIGVTKLLRDPASPLAFRMEGYIEGAFVSFSRVEPDDLVTASGVVEAVHQGLMVTCDISAKWVGSCVRCLEEARGRIECSLRELFEHEGSENEECYRYSGDVLDLSEMVQDALVLELPAVPLCKLDCLGLCSVCGGNKNEVPCACEDAVIDPRWSKLDTLRDGLGS